MPIGSQSGTEQAPLPTRVKEGTTHPELRLHNGDDLRKWEMWMRKDVRCRSLAAVYRGKTSTQKRGGRAQAVFGCQFTVVLGLMNVHRGNG
jgi:hypothetical protein